MNTVEKGKIGEKIAEEYLISLGMTTICRNYRYMKSEIDLIMQDADTIVFVEVKARKSDTMGSGFEAINIRKQKNIIRGAKGYCLENDCFDEYLRFDAVEVDLKSGKVSRYAKSAFIDEEYSNNY